VSKAFPYFKYASPLEGEVGPQVRVGGNASTQRFAGNNAMATTLPPTRQRYALPTSPSRGEALKGMAV
jgi:hypothetical protein